MIDNTVLKTANEAVYNYTTTATRKVVDFQSNLVKDWIELNKTLYDMSPAKEWVSNFNKYTSEKK